MNVLQYFRNITTFVFDVDGVLTDGNVYILRNGLMARRMNIKDGYALQLAIKKSYRILIISGSDSLEVTHRLHNLGVVDILMKVENKKFLLQEYMHKNQLHKEEILFMGDDIPDYEAMKEVGLAACPQDAVMEIKNIAHYISPLKGGEGCGRDVIEKTLKLRGDWAIDTSISSK